MTLIAILTLALGIGANTAIFSVVYATLICPLPFPDQERLVMLWKKDTINNNPLVELSIPVVRDWQTQNKSFENIAVMPATVFGYGYTLTGHGDPVVLESAKVGGSYFSILGGQALLGRLINDGDDKVNGPNVAVISDKLWRDRFSGDPKIIGRIITLNNTGFTVIGVLPASFDFPHTVSLWVPIAATTPPLASERYGYTFLKAVGKLKPGVTIEQGEADLNSVIARTAIQHPETESGSHKITITPLIDYLYGSTKTGLWAAYIATGLLLLIASANIAALMLARSIARRKELALRSALGAGRRQLITQLLCETLTLSVCGGGVGILAAYYLIKVMKYVAPSDIQRLDNAQINPIVLMIVILCTFITMIICGLLPAIYESKINPSETFAETGTRSVGSQSGNKFLKSIIVCQTALTIMLLIGAMLVMRSFMNLSNVPLGINTKGVLTTQLKLNNSNYKSVDDRRAFFRQFIERLESQPGIEAASGVLIRPLQGVEGWYTTFSFAGQSQQDARKNPDLNYVSIHPHYFDVMGMSLKTGRGFNYLDNSSNNNVAVINESMAKKYLKSAHNAVGKSINLGLGGERTIIGVVNDARNHVLQKDEMDVYVPYEQAGPVMNHFAIRTTLDKTSAIAIVRRELAAIDPQHGISDIATMEELVTISLAKPKFSASILNFLGGAALLLVLVGIYGTTMYSVNQRYAELGIRAALGARAIDITRLIIESIMRPITTGIVFGILAAFVLTRYLSGLLYGVGSIDPLTFGVIGLVMIATAIVACLIPIRRATRVDPMIVLRSE